MTISTPNGGTVAQCLHGGPAGADHQRQRSDRGKRRNYRRVGQQPADADLTGTRPNYSFNTRAPVFSGDNTIQVSAVNEYGTGSDYTTVECDDGIKDIHVQAYLAPGWLRLRPALHPARRARDVPRQLLLSQP